MHDTFNFFHAYIEKEIIRKLKFVRADNSGKYREPFEQYCRSHRIILKKSLPKTLQQNGIEEKMNITIEKGVRCMLSYAKLSKSFWAEVMRIVVDLVNIYPLVLLDNDVPERVWTKKDVS